MASSTVLPDTAPEIVVALIQQAEKYGASDIHLQMRGTEAEIFLRLDGVMVPAGKLSAKVAGLVFGRIKFLAKLKTYLASLPQDGRIAKEDVQAHSDLRVATYPTITGEKIVLRLFKQHEIPSLSALHLDEQTSKALQAFLRQSSGLLLLTGPAGSGKTTTIYACLEYLAQNGGRHIITIEDPVERIIPQIMQTEVKEECGLTFAKAARHLLRQDPEILVLGEIRDPQTADIAVRATLTGHMVIATLHAGSCQGVVQRLVTMCSDRYAVMAALEMIINQRLMRRLCQHCQGKGCSDCLGTGYRGRVPVAEWVRFDEQLRCRIRQEGPITLAPRVTIREAARALISRYITDQAEYIRMFGDEV